MHKHPSIYSQSLEGERAHVIIQTQQINTTTVCKPEVLFVFLFVCFGPTKWLCGAISFHWTSAVLSSHSVSTPPFFQRLQAPSFCSGAPWAAPILNSTVCVQSSPHQMPELSPFVTGPGGTTHHPGFDSSILSTL